MKATHVKAILDQLIEKAGYDAEVKMFDRDGRECEPDFITSHASVPDPADPSKNIIACIGATIVPRRH